MEAVKACVEKAKQVEPLEEVIDRLIIRIKDRHVQRLRRGDCTLEMGFILSDLLTNYERISDHCSNVAVAVIELDHSDFETHRYLNAVKNGDAEFQRAYAVYQNKYLLE